MTQLRDPYRVLGVPRGASLDEIKRAYRRLAKQVHPDSGGVRTLARFLEIQAAYEQLVVDRLGSNGRATDSGAARPSWQADPARADATRRAYGNRGRRAGARASGAGAGAEAAGTGAAAESDDRRAGRDAASDGEGPPRGRPPRRGRRKATLGSTSYDEAADQPFDPDWTGASWYGTTSGTYWTLNPREYADPRKHGPEYQARARRQAGTTPETPDPAAREGWPGASIDERESEPASEPDERPHGQADDGAAGPDDSTGAGPDGAAAGAGWRPAAETSAGPAWTAAPGTGRGVDPPRPTEPAPLLPDLERLLDPTTRRTPLARIGLAMVGGVPVALWLGWLLGELTGCGRFAATCEPGVVSLSWVAGLGLVVALVVLPGLATVLVMGALGAVLAAIPATVILTATGGARMPDESAIMLGVVLTLGWFAGVALAARRWYRHSRRAGPVS